MVALSKIREAGFQVSLIGDSFEISPAGNLTKLQREFLKSHKAEIIIELRTEANRISAHDRQTLMAYLDAIGETDQAMIDEYLTECASDLKILAEQLQQANDYLQVESGDTSGFVRCSDCNHHLGDQCRLHVWRVVTGKWRRCSGYTRHL